MRKTLVAASVAAFAVYSADVLADDTTATQPQPTAQPAPAPAAPTGQPQTSAVQATAALQTANPTVPVSTTTTTSAPDPTVSTLPREKETVTLYQKFRPNRTYLYTGGAIFIGSYATTAAVTAVNENDRTLFIPVVGPWLHLADQPDNSTSMDTILTAGSGVLQGAGVLLMTASLFVPEKVPAATIQAGNMKINLTPTSYGRGSAGFGAVGTF